MSRFGCIGFFYYWVFFFFFCIRLFPILDHHRYLGAVLFVTLLVVLIQMLFEWRGIIVADDHILTKATLVGCIVFDSHDLQLAIAAGALYHYRLNCGLICFEDDLHFWFKPRFTV